MVKVVMVDGSTVIYETASRYQIGGEFVNVLGPDGALASIKAEHVKRVEVVVDEADAGKPV